MITAIKSLYPDLPHPELDKNDSDYTFSLKKHFYEILCNTKFPSNLDEEWRKIRLGTFNMGDYLETEKSLRIQTHNIEDRFVQPILNESDFTKKILDELTTGKKIPKKNQFFSLLAQTYSQLSLIIEIPSNYESNLPLIIESSFKDYSRSAFFNVFIKVGKNTRVSLEDRCIMPVSESNNLLSSNFYVLLEENANIDFIQNENFFMNCFHFREYSFFQKRDSSTKIHSYNSGGLKGKTFFNIYLEESGSNSSIFGANSCIKREFQDVEFSISHLNSNTNSSIKFKTVVKEKSHHIFTGNLFIPQSSRKVEASQINHNLFLEKTARSESMPRLEVFSEDVKCSHGATMSEVEDDQLFYLLSRGISYTTAVKLIVEGFLSEVIDEIRSEEIKQELKTRLLQRLKL